MKQNVGYSTENAVKDLFRINRGQPVMKCSFTENKKAFQLNANRPFSARFWQRHLWSIWHILTSCMNSTIGIHSTNFKTGGEKRAKKRYVWTRPYPSFNYDHSLALRCVAIK